MRLSSLFFEVDFVVKDFACPHKEVQYGIEQVISFLLYRLLDLRTALDLHQNLISGQDGHTLYDLPDGVFAPFCDRGCGALYSFFCLLHAGADAVGIGAALQDSFFLLFECSLLGRISANCALQASLSSASMASRHSCWNARRAASSGVQCRQRLMV